MRPYSTTLIDVAARIYETQFHGCYPARDWVNHDLIIALDLGRTPGREDFFEQVQQDGSDWLLLSTARFEREFGSKVRVTRQSSSSEIAMRDTAGRSRQ